MIEFEVGSIPSRSVTIPVRDELDNPINIVGYTGYRLEMLGADGEPVDLSGVVLTEVATLIGVLTATFPKDRSLFTKKGVYSLRLVLEGADGSRDITRPNEIKVREFGRIR